MPTQAPQFAMSTIQQILLLIGRGWKLVVRNPVSIMRLAMAIIIGLVIGTLFLNTSTDANGTTLRSGFVLTLMFISFLNSSMAPLEDLYADRNTFYIHRQANVSELECGCLKRSWILCMFAALLLQNANFSPCFVDDCSHIAFFCCLRSSIVQCPIIHRKLSITFPWHGVKPSCWSSVHSSSLECKFDSHHPWIFSVSAFTINKF